MKSTKDQEKSTQLNFSRRELNLVGNILKTRMVEDLCSKYQNQIRVMKSMKDLSFIWWVKILRCLKNWTDSDSYHQRIHHLWVLELKYGSTLTMTTQILCQNTRISLRQCSLKLGMSILQRQLSSLTWKEMRKNKLNPRMIKLKQVNEKVKLIYLIRFCL